MGVKYIWILIFCVASLFSATAQNTIFDKITLVTGEVYVGDIIAKTDEMVMIKTLEGARYQFQLIQVKAIGKTTQRVEPKSGRTKYGDDNPFCVQIETGAGVLNVSDAFGTVPVGEIDFCIGYKKINNGKFFAGLGSGYSILYMSESKSTISLIPLYLRLRHTFCPEKISPFVGMDAGYSFGPDELYRGGVLIRVNAGVSIPINSKSLFFAGASAGLQQMKLNYTLQNEFGAYNAFGFQTPFSAGIKAGIQF